MTVTDADRARARFFSTREENAIVDLAVRVLSTPPSEILVTQESARRLARGVVGLQTERDALIRKIGERHEQFVAELRDMSTLPVTDPDALAELIGRFVSDIRLICDFNKFN